LPEHLSPTRQFGSLNPLATYVLRPGGYAIIFRDRMEVAVVSTPPGLFLPGGGQEGAEEARDAAIREAEEEVGLRIRLGAEIGVADELAFAADEQTHYRKRCTFFLAEVVSNTGACEAGHQLLWLPIEDAITRLTHESQRWAVKEAWRILKSE
jgi:8-oxo-dGTP pyrophosphatase MutT (NUDIX family)